MKLILQHIMEASQYRPYLAKYMVQNHLSCMHDKLVDGLIDRLIDESIN